MHRILRILFISAICAGVVYAGTGGVGGIDRGRTMGARLAISSDADILSIQKWIDAYNIEIISVVESQGVAVIFYKN